MSAKAGPAAVSQVMNTPDLLDLCRRPVMTEFVLDALPDVEAGMPVNMARVYLYAIRRKMERDIKAERTFTSMADKLYFMCELSWEMLDNDKMSLNYRLFPDRLRRLFGSRVMEEKDLDHWHYDMMGQTILVRNADGDYQPAHRSLLEFFIAYKFAAEMGALASDFSDIARSQSHVDASLSPQAYAWSKYFARESDKNGNIVSIRPLLRFSREPLEKLAGTVGKRKLTPTVHDFIKKMVEAEPLWDVVDATKSRRLAECQYVGGNAATLLAQLGQDFSGRTLAETVIVGADLGPVNLSGSDLRGSHISDVSMDLPVVRNAD